MKPFAGLIYCGYCNAPMFLATVTKPNGRRYRYYICRVDEKRAHRECPLHRVPAETLEQLLLNRIAARLKTPTMRQIAQALNMDRSFVARTLQLANPAPDIVKAIWENRQPVSLTLDKLRRGDRKSVV